MRKNVISGLIYFFLTACLVFQIGCFKNDDKAPENLAELSSIAGPISFKIMLPPEAKANLATDVASSAAKVEVASPSSLIRAATEGVTPEVTFKLNLINIGNTSMPVSPVVKTVPIVDGSATVTFTGIPACPCIGEVKIVGGSINSFTDFHGALDLKRGEQNTLEVAPVNSKMKQDFVAYVAKQVVANSVLFGKAVIGLVEMISQSIASLDAQKETAYDDAVNLFAGFVNVDIIISSGGIEVPSVVGKTKEVAQAELTAKSLTYLISTVYHETIPAGTVISQNPSAWAKVDSGTQVNLVVSLGLQTSEYLSATPLLGGYYWEGQDIKLSLTLPEGSETVSKVEFFDGSNGYTDVSPPYEFSITKISGQKTYSATVTFSSGSTQTFTKTVTCKSIIEKVNVQLSNGSIGILYPNSSIPSVDSVPPNIATFVITLAPEIDVKPNTFSLTALRMSTGRSANIIAENDALKLSHSGNILTATITSTGSGLQTLRPGETYKVQFNSGNVTIGGTVLPVSAPSYQFKTANDSYFLFDKSTGTITGFMGNMSTSLTIPSSIYGVTVTRIGDWAFNNKGLSSVIFPSTLTSIGAYSFGSNQLTSLTIPNSVVVIGAEAFRYNQLTSITIGTGVTIGDRLLTTNQYFRDAYQGSGAGTYVGTQNGTWSLSGTSTGTGTGTDPYSTGTSTGTDPYDPFGN